MTMLHVAVERELICSQLDRMIASRVFAASRSSSQFLRYVVEETLAGRADQIKEYSVGVAVFDRGEQFDPKADGVVRVEATRLRARLREYYQNEGREDALTIDLPKGAYVPVFHTNLVPEPRSVGPRRWRKASAAALCLVALTVAVGFWWQRSKQTTAQPGDLYLRARYHSQQQNKAGIDTAISHLEQAVALDPKFAAAWADLAQAYVWKLFLFEPEDRQLEEKAFVAAEKALSLDKNLAVAHVARGRLLWTPKHRFPHEKAIREYRMALASDATLDEARNQLALIYSHIGYFDESMQQSLQATLSNPTRHLVSYRDAQTLAFQRKFDESLDVLKGIPDEINPSLVGYQTAWVLFNLGRRAEASERLVQLLGRYPQDTGGLFTGLQAVIAAASGDSETAEKTIRVAAGKGAGFGHFHHTAYHIGTAWALLGRPDEAVQWLERAAGEGFPCYPLFAADPNLDALRSNPKFADFMRKLRQEWLGYRALF